MLVKTVISLYSSEPSTAVGSSPLLPEVEHLVSAASQRRLTGSSPGCRNSAERPRWEGGAGRSEGGGGSAVVGGVRSRRTEQVAWSQVGRKAGNRALPAPSPPQCALWSDRLIPKCRSFLPPEELAVFSSSAAEKS